MQAMNDLLLHNDTKAFDQVDTTFDQNNITIN